MRSIVKKDGQTRFFLQDRISQKSGDQIAQSSPMDRAEREMNRLADEQIPFFFLIDYEMNHPLVHPLQNPGPFRFSIKPDFKQKDSSHKTANSIENQKNDSLNNREPALSFSQIQPIAQTSYIQKCREVIRREKEGYSFLTNLTFPSVVSLASSEHRTEEESLIEIYEQSTAPFRLLFLPSSESIPSQPGSFAPFVVFSPERFVRIVDQTIHTHPMKGTIDARIENAALKLRQNQKEMAEHRTIVDLMRNDLGKVSSRVRVQDFAYLETITNSKNEPLLQMSSHITGELFDWYLNRPGSLFRELLPAGSINGAPSRETMRIIKEIEKIPRGYYTGVAGVYYGSGGGPNGELLDSFVLIRFIEKHTSEDGRTCLRYRSGGGITIYSNPEDEYNELIQKIYIPT